MVRNDCSFRKIEPVPDTVYLTAVNVKNMSDLKKGG